MSKQLPAVTIDEQERMGLRRIQRPANYVPPMPVRRAELPATTATSYQIDAHPSAQLGSITHTSAVDRAKGYTIIQAPLAAIMAVLVLAVVKSLADFPLLSFAAFLTFWISFAVVWLVGWGLTLLLSAEGVAFYESKRKWDVVQREQDERWNHYNRQYDNAAPPRRSSAYPSFGRAMLGGIDWVTVVVATIAVWLLIIGLWVLTGSLQ